jgi:hypothetical protein
MRACSVSEQDSHIPLDRRTFLRGLSRSGRGRHESGSPSFSISTKPKAEDGKSVTRAARAQQPPILDFGFMKAPNSFRLPKTLCFHEQGKRINVKVALETVSKLSEPSILSDIGKLLTLLWALVFEPQHILKMMNHLMNEHG